jgi:hypothetical protein
MLRIAKIWGTSGSTNLQAVMHPGIRSSCSAVQPHGSPLPRLSFHIPLRAGFSHRACPSNCHHFTFVRQNSREFHHIALDRQRQPARWHSTGPAGMLTWESQSTHHVLPIVNGCRSRIIQARDGACYQHPQSNQYRGGLAQTYVRNLRDSRSKLIVTTGKHVRACIVYTWDHKSSASFWQGMKVYVATETPASDPLHALGRPEHH